MVQRTEALGDVANEFLFENDKVKVWHLNLAPGESSAWHVHDLDYITIVINPGTLRRESEGEVPEDLENPVGRVQYRKAEKAHRVTNTGATHYRNTLIEIK